MAFRFEGAMRGLGEGMAATGKQSFIIEAERLRDARLDQYRRGQATQASALRSAEKATERQAQEQFARQQYGDAGSSVNLKAAHESALDAAKADSAEARKVGLMTDPKSSVGLLRQQALGDEARQRGHKREDEASTRSHELDKLRFEYGLKGELLQETADLGLGETKNAGKVQLHNGQWVSETDLSNIFKRQHMDPTELGGYTMKHGAPEYLAWRDQMVAPAFRHGKVGPSKQEMEAAALQAEREAEAWVKEQAGFFSSDKSDFKDYGGNRQTAQRRKEKQIYQELLGGMMGQGGGGGLLSQGLPAGGPAAAPGAAQPSPRHIQQLRANAGNPAAIKAFDDTYGPGAAEQILRQP